MKTCNDIIQAAMKQSAEIDAGTLPRGSYSSRVKPKQQNQPPTFGCKPADDHAVDQYSSMELDTWGT